MKEKKMSRPNQSVRAQVLIIDDEETLRKTMASELTKINFGVTTAENSEVGCDLAKDFPFDVAITDLRMPRMDGLQALLALKKIDPHLEVIVLTGYATLDTAINCLKQGAYDYLQRPVNPTELCLMTEKALEKRRLKSIVALYEAARTLQSTLKTNQIVQSGLELAQKVADTQVVSLVLKYNKRVEIHRSESSNQPSRAMLKVITNEVTIHRNQLLYNHTENPSEKTPAWLDHDVSSVIAYPLIGRKEVLGALVLVRHKESPGYTMEEMQRGSIFSMQLALTLDNAQLYGKLEQKLTELRNTRTKLRITKNRFLATKGKELKQKDSLNPFRYVTSRI